jgi:hypothetical protein
VPYVVQVKADTWASPQQVRPVAASYQGKGRRPRPARPPAAVLAEASGHLGRAALLRGADLAAGQQGPAAFLLPGAARPARRRHTPPPGAAGWWELPVRWLLVEWPAGAPEPVTYWLSGLPEDTPIVELVRLGELRWRIEQDYRERKGALGLDHFEVAALVAGTTT